MAPKGDERPAITASRSVRGSDRECLDGRSARSARVNCSTPPGARKCRSVPIYSSRWAAIRWNGSSHLGLTASEGLDGCEYDECLYRIEAGVTPARRGSPAARLTGGARRRDNACPHQRSGRRPPQHRVHGWGHTGHCPPGVEAAAVIDRPLSGVSNGHAGPFMAMLCALMARVSSKKRFSRIATCMSPELRRWGADMSHGRSAIVKGGLRTIPVAQVLAPLRGPFALR